MIGNWLRNLIREELAAALRAHYRAELIAQRINDNPPRHCGCDMKLLASEIEPEAGRVETSWCCPSCKQIERRTSPAGTDWLSGDPILPDVQITRHGVESVRQQQAQRIVDDAVAAARRQREAEKNSTAQPLRERPRTPDEPPDQGDAR